ncbi:MAG: pseudouridine synthase [Bacteroidales bacterium]
MQDKDKKNSGRKGVSEKRDNSSSRKGTKKLQTDRNKPAGRSVRSEEQDRGKLSEKPRQPGRVGRSRSEGRSLDEGGPVRNKPERPFRQGKDNEPGSKSAGERKEDVHPFEKFRRENAVSGRKDKRAERGDREKRFERGDRDKRSGSNRDRKFERGERDNKQKSGDNFSGNKPYSPKEIRLNRYIANSGVCSRREADDYILAGHVKVNDKVVKELGAKVTYSDTVRFKGKRLNPEKKIYLLLNKPKDYISTVDDPYAKRTVMDLVRSSCRERIYPVGRLDRLTTGLLLFTNDGDLTKKLTHPSHQVTKIYQVGLDRPLERADMEKIAAGVELEDGPVHADEISYVDPVDKSQIGIQLHSGKNRIIRRIFKHLDYKVVKLDRVFFAGLTKKNLPRGKWRFLNEKEVNRLKMNIFQ